MNSTLSLIERMVREQLRGNGVRDEAVLEAMRTVPRHAFVHPDQRDEAYDDRPLPTADGQTISQPFIVARMTELLKVRPGLKVLEIGTGSGYQTAILAHLGGEVTSVESRAGLADSARRRLAELGLADNVRIVVGDGTLGEPTHAPYDRILVTAGAPEIPPAYREQLADDGRIVIPLGARELQYLTVVERTGDDWRETVDLPCRFVPLTGRQGWDAL